MTMLSIVFGLFLFVVFDRIRMHFARHPLGESPIATDPAERARIEAMKDPRQYRDLGPSRFCRCIGCPNMAHDGGLCRTCIQEKADWRGAL